MSTVAAAAATCETSAATHAGCISVCCRRRRHVWRACSAYWDASPLAYTPNPLQLTAPTHGDLLGELTYVTTAPTPASADAVRIVSNVNLRGIAELWITTETRDAVDAAARGQRCCTAFPDRGGIDVVHFDLTPPLGSKFVATGTAAVEVELDANPVQF